MYNETSDVHPSTLQQNKKNFFFSSLKCVARNQIFTNKPFRSLAREKPSQHEYNYNSANVSFMGTWLKRNKISS